MNTLNLQHRAAYVNFVTWIYTPESDKHKKPIFNNVINYQKRFDNVKNEIEEVGFSEFIYGKYWRLEL